MRAMKILLKYLKSDINVFKIFKPTKPLLRKMDLSQHILSESPNESEVSLDLCNFLMRYHRSIDYADFSESPYVV
jgi:hypothetical protein